MTAVAFEHAVGSRWIVSVILAAALLSLFKVFNGNLVAASRLVFAMGRRGLVDGRVGQVHPAQSDAVGRRALVGIAHRRVHVSWRRHPGADSRMSARLAVCGWDGWPPAPRIIECARYRASAWWRLWAALVGLLMILMKVLPVVPGTLQPLRMAGSGNLDRAGRDRQRVGSNVAPASAGCRVGVSPTHELATIVPSK